MKIAEHVLKLFFGLRLLRDRGFGFFDALRFMFKRYTIPRNCVDGAAFKTPEKIVLKSREDFAQYMTMFVENCYRMDIWGYELKSNPEALILDLGANRGFFTALCLSFNKRARIFLFDLFEGLRPYIERHIKETEGERCKIIIAALTDDQDIFVDVNADNILDTSNTLLGRTGTTVARVPTIRLDSWYAAQEFEHKPFMVKMDIEGSEKLVIPSGINVLRDSKYLIIEFHSSREMAELLLPTHSILFEQITGPCTSVVILRKLEGNN